MSESSSRGPVEVSALHAREGLAGFLLSNRWPDTTYEWGEFLLLAVQLAAVPGMLGHSTVFSIREELPDEPLPGAVGVVLAEGEMVGEHALEPARFARRVLPGLVVLHPPGEQASGRASRDVASGCVLLPGLPHLGLDHRAAWAVADRAGQVSELRTRSGVDPGHDVDTAVLALLLAA